MLQRFYHQQNQLRDRQERRQRASSSGATATTAAPTENTNPFLSQIPKFRPDYSPAPIASQASHIPHYRYVDQRSPLALAAAAASANGSPKHQFYFGAAGGSSNHTSPLQMRRMQQPQPQPPQHGDMDGIDYGASLQRPEAECVVDTRPKAIGRPAKTNGKAGNLASEAGADPEDPGKDCVWLFCSHWHFIHRFLLPFPHTHKTLSCIAPPFKSALIQQNRNKQTIKHLTHTFAHPLLSCCVHSSSVVYETKTRLVQFPCRRGQAALRLLR